MKSNLLLLCFFVLPAFSYANMAKPWVDGSQHSTIYGNDNCTVEHETISIRMIENEYNEHYANFQIEYIIQSDTNQIIPLMFLGIGLSKTRMVEVNGRRADIIPLDSINESHPFFVKKGDCYYVKYTENDNFCVEKDDLIYFFAELDKGENAIYVEYDADMEYNRLGFIRNYKLEYSLYPSRFWKSFGEIDINLELDENFEIKESNIGIPEVENNTAKWKIKEIEEDTILLTISPKISTISKILLGLNPFGISGIALLILLFLHIVLLRRWTKKSVLWIGILLVPILFYCVFFASFPLIDLSLGQADSQHGYIFLYIFMFPILIIFYGLIMWAIYKIMVMHNSAWRNKNRQ